MIWALLWLSQPALPLVNMSDSSINLVSDEIQKSRLDKEKSSKKKLLSIAAIVIFSAILLILLFVYFFSEKKLSSLEEEKLFITKRIEANREVEKLAISIQERSDVFNSLYSNRQVYSDIVIKISDLLPEEVVLSSLTFNENSVDLAGETPSYAALAKFIQESNKAIEQKNISFPFDLISLKQASLDSQTGKIMFVISFQLIVEDKFELPEKTEVEQEPVI